MKMGDKVIVINKMNAKGTIVTEPKIIFGNKLYGIKFDNTELNELFNPYYIDEALLEKI